MEGHQKFLVGGGLLKANILEVKYEAELEFTGGEGAKQKTLCGGSMDIFWNVTIRVCTLSWLSKFSSAMFQLSFTGVVTKCSTSRFSKMMTESTTCGSRSFHP